MVATILYETRRNAVDARIPLKQKLHLRQREFTTTSYCEAINYLLEKYASDDVIIALDGDKMRSNEPLTNYPTKYAEAL